MNMKEFKQFMERMNAQHIEVDRPGIENKIQHDRLKHVTFLEKFLGPFLAVIFDWPNFDWQSRQVSYSE